MRGFHSGSLASTNRNSHRRCSVRKVFLKISQNSSGKQLEENKKILHCSCLSVIFENFSGTPFLQNTSCWLLPEIFRKVNAQSTSEQLPLYFSPLLYFQKHPPRGFLQNRCYSKFRKIHRKTSVSKSLF